MFQICLGVQKATYLPILADTKFNSRALEEWKLRGKNNTRPVKLTKCQAFFRTTVDGIERNVRILIRGTQDSSSITVIR